MKLLAHRVFVLEGVFEELIDGPGQSSGGHLINHTCTHAFKEATQSCGRVYGDHGVHNTPHIHLAIQDTQHAALLSVKEGFADVKWRSSSCCYCSGNCSRYYMGGWIVSSERIYVVLGQLVEDKVYRLEGNIHDKLCDKTAVESSDAFRTVDASGTVQTRLVWTLVHLHSLLYHCRLIEKLIIQFDV